MVGRCKFWGLSLLPLAVLLLAWPASGQPGVDPPDTVYHEGLELEPEATYKSFPATPEYRAYLPPSVDLAPSLPLPGKQGRQSSCVGWAVGYAVRAYYERAFDGRDNRQSENIPSPAYIYNSIRAGDCERGSQIPKALDLLKAGSLSLREYPYYEDTCPAPSASEQVRATEFRIMHWFRVGTSNLDQIKGELAHGHPVVFARKFAPSFHRHRGTTAVYYRQAGESDKPSGHAVAIIGYDEHRQAMRIMNSWGSVWGDGGYAWVSYNEIRDGRAYVMRPAKKIAPRIAPKIAPPPPPPPAPPEPPPPMPPEPPRPVVTDLECAKVTLAKEGGKTRVRGFVGKAEQVETLKQRFKDQNPDIDVAVRPWPQCEALLTLDGALAAADLPAVRILAPQKELKQGELLKIEVTSSQQPAHVHVAYIQADGSVVHLVQADADNLRTVDRGRVLKFGDGEEGRASFVVREPFGPEMVIVLASRSPVFPEPRPAAETEREFLTALRRVLALKAGSGMPAGGIRAAVATLVTVEN